MAGVVDLRFGKSLYAAATIVVACSLAVVGLAWWQSTGTTDGMDAVRGVGGSGVAVAVLCVVGAGGVLWLGWYWLNLASDITKIAERIRKDGSGSHTPDSKSLRARSGAAGALIAAVADCLQDSTDRIKSLEEEAKEMEWPIEISGYLNPPIKPEPLYNLLIDIFSQPGERFDLPEDILTTEAQTATEHPLNILIAEDDPTNQKVIAMILTHLGYQPDITSNGLEVIAALEDKRYDVILMDLQMPEMDGLSTTSYIRAALPLDKQPYIIALTADARQEARDAMFSEGVNEYLTKPVHGEMLSQALEYASRNQQSRDLHIRLPEETPLQTYPGESPIDESVLADFISIMGNDSSAALVELFDSFIENTPGLVQDMNDAAANEDWPRVRWAAHTLKGNSELFGGIRLAQKCRELEKRIDSGVFDDIPEYVDHIEVEFAQIQALIIAKREEL